MDRSEYITWIESYFLSSLFFLLKLDLRVASKIQLPF